MLRRVLPLLFVGLAACRPAYVSPYASEIAFIGRVDRAAPEGPRFAWGGTSFRLRFRGTSVTLLLRDLPKHGLKDNDGKTFPNRYRVVIDGVPRPDLYVEGPGEAYRVAENLPDGEHTLEVYKQSEPLVGETQLLGVLLDPWRGPLPATPSAATRRLELVGDSVLAGYGDEGADSSCPFDSKTQNGFLAFGPLAARALGAEYVTLAWSGKGLYRNYDLSTTDTLVDLYERTLPERADSHEGATGWEPDAVVLNGGANDFAHDDPGVDRIATRYRELVRAVLRRHPKAQVICLVGPGTQDEWPPNVFARTKLRAIAQGVVAEVNDPRVHFLEMPKFQDRGPRGCRGHPNLAQHRDAAEQLTRALSELLGWTPVASPEPAQAASRQTP